VDWRGLGYLAGACSLYATTLRPSQTPFPGNKAVDFVTADFPYQGPSGGTVMKVMKKVTDDVICCHGIRSDAIWVRQRRGEEEDIFKQ
jgi:hypothetical protein